MPSKIALRTLCLLALWLLYQNFNVATSVSNAPLFPSKPLLSAPAVWPTLLSHLQGTNPHYTPPYKIKTVVLDAGHGGKDPGCLGATSHEKHNTLAIVLKLGALIEAQFPDVKVIYTRDTDVFVELNERAAIANRNKADLFISVHCNSLSVSSAKGTETYVMGLHTAKHNLEVAKRENASIYLEDNYEKNYEGYDPNSPEAHIIGSMYQSAYLEQSILLASLVQHHANVTADREDRGVKQAGFLVLRETAMPAVLIESGYLTNPGEEAFLASEAGREKVALAIFKSFEGYKQQLETGKKVDLPKKVAKAKSKEPASPPARKNPSPEVLAVEKSKESSSTAADTPKAVTAKAGPGAPVLVKKTQSVATGYRIHLVSWKSRMDMNVGQLGLISGVKEEKADGQYHYYTATFATRKEAEELLPDIKNLGFRTARIVEAGGMK